MLYLSRKVGESIVINNTITMTLVEVRGKTVKIGFTYPPDATILRQEVHERISAENAAATQVDRAVLDLDFDFDLARKQEGGE